MYKIDIIYTWSLGNVKIILNYLLKINYLIKMKNYKRIMYEEEKSKKEK